MQDLLDEVERKRHKARVLLQWDDLEAALFRKYFPFVTVPTASMTPRAVASSVAQLRSAKTWGAYRRHARSLLYNIRNCPHASEWCGGGGTEGKGAEWLVEQAAHTLWPERWPERENMRLVETREFLEQEVGEMDNMQCRKCRGHFVRHTQLQTRSADEGFTNFFHCVSCDNRWKTG